MSDSTQRIDTLDGKSINMKIRDLDGYSFSGSVVNEGVASLKMACTLLTSEKMTDLIDQVNKYLANSKKRTHSISWFSTSLTTVNFYCVINEAVV